MSAWGQWGAAYWQACVWRRWFSVCTSPSRVRPSGKHWWDRSLKKSPGKIFLTFLYFSATDLQTSKSIVAKVKEVFIHSGNRAWIFLLILFTALVLLILLLSLLHNLRCVLLLSSVYGTTTLWTSWAEYANTAGVRPSGAGNCTMRANFGVLAGPPSLAIVSTGAGVEDGCS